VTGSRQPENEIETVLCEGVRHRAWMACINGMITRRTNGG
jgi:hypothetical protein